MSATLRWTCPMSTPGSMLTARRYRLANAGAPGRGLLPTGMGQGGRRARPCLLCDRYGPQGVEPLNAAAASAKSTSSRACVRADIGDLLSARGVRERHTQALSPIVVKVACPFD